jgi:hypothetical protein
MPKANVTEENLKKAYMNFVESVAPEEEKIYRWIERSRNGRRLNLRGSYLL